ncbi:MAG: hypothetical protein CME21_17855 [Gemmatimonadetes bacterium]|mgnify:CR=1 FL=1|nr:hypothetical protein [Gemmatimonadota bacterium]
MQGDVVGYGADPAVSLEIIKSRASLIVAETIVNPTAPLSIKECYEAMVICESLGKVSEGCRW